MKFVELIHSNHWLSIEYTLIGLYPDQEQNIGAYKSVFDRLQKLNPIEEEMQIVLTQYFDDETNEKRYVDVSGYKETLDEDSLTNSYAIEFTPWKKWLGMQISKDTLQRFDQLEIIAHCLYEMTFCGYDEEEIQEKFSDIKNSVEGYKNMTDEEKIKNSKSLDDLLNKSD
jgi:hypothetical protein